MAVNDNLPGAVPLILGRTQEHAERERAAYDTKLKQIDNVFTYHSPNPAQQGTYETLRREARALALTIVNTTPSSREQSLALTKLEEVIFFANAAVARHA